jgi:phosphate:Na+ symporter
MELFRYMDKDKHLRGLLILAVLALIFVAASPALAASGAKPIKWGFMIMKLAGGLAIFLYGMEMMGDALKLVAGDRMRDILAKLTTNRFMGLLTGAGVTAVVQSSSITTVMLVGFVSAGLMSSVQAIGVIFGANIGTTITAQIIAFKVSKFALGLVAVGFLMWFTSNKEKIKQYGALILGLGLVFFGLAVMSGAMKPLRTYQPFIDLMQQVSNPMIGILVAAAFTGLVQSSSATTGVVIAMATQGLISLEGGIALILGANIGTCVTAGLAAIGKPREAVRVAVAHITFNILGVVIIMWFIPIFAETIRSISPMAPDLTGVDRLAAETPRQIANAHTAFNIGFSLLFLPLVGVLAKFTEMVIPIREKTTAEKAMAKFQPRYLDDLLIGTPPMALSMVRREVSRMGEVVEEMLGGVPDSVFVGNVDKAAQIREMDDRVDNIYAAIARYLSKVGRENLSARNADEAVALATANSEIENIGDIVETHMHHLATVCNANSITFAEADLEILRSYHAKVFVAFKETIVAVEHDRRETAAKVIEAEEDIVGGMEKLFIERQAKFMREDHTPEEMAAFTLETDILENLKRIYEHTKRIARLVTRQEFSTALVLVPED